MCQLFVSVIHRRTRTRHQTAAPVTDSHQRAGNLHLSLSHSLSVCLLCPSLSLGFHLLTLPCLCFTGPNWGSVPGSQEAFWGIQQNGTFLFVQHDFCSLKHKKLFICLGLQKLTSLQLVICLPLTSDWQMFLLSKQFTQWDETLRKLEEAKGIRPVE